MAAHYSGGPTLPPASSPHPVPSAAGLGWDPYRGAVSKPRGLPVWTCAERGLIGDGVGELQPKAASGFFTQHLSGPARMPRARSQPAVVAGRTRLCGPLISLALHRSPQFSHLHRKHLLSTSQSHLRAGSCLHRPPLLPLSSLGSPVSQRGVTLW